MLKIVASGKTGGVDDTGPHPVTQPLTSKSTDASGFANGTTFIGVGIYQ